MIKVIKVINVINVKTIDWIPAATMKARGITARSYKKLEQRSARQSLLADLRGHLALPSDVSTFLKCADAIDAAICVLAGADFLAGRCLEPTDFTIAKKEGWIWVTKPS